MKADSLFDALSSEYEKTIDSCPSFVASNSSFINIQDKVAQDELSLASIKSAQTPCQIGQFRLSANRISPMKRIMLLKFLLKKTIQLELHRSVFANSSTYLDLYFRKSEKLIQFNDLQIIGFAAFMVACKVEGNTFCKTSSNQDNDKLKDYQMRIMKTLNYNLYPQTYVIFVYQFMFMWDEFVDSSEYDFNESDRYLVQNKFSYLKLKSLLQKIECVNLVEESLSYNCKQLAFNLFFLETIFNLSQMKAANIKKSKLKHLVIQQAYSNNLFRESTGIFKQFCELYSQQLGDVSLSLIIGLYLLNFIKLKIDSNIVNEKCLYYEEFRNRQTQSPFALRQITKFLNK